MKSEMRLIKNAFEYKKIEEIPIMGQGARGIYVLYKQRGFKNDESHHYDVVYVGMTSKSIRGRLKSHKKSKENLWTHFSAFEVWDNISNDEITEKVYFVIFTGLTNMRTKSMLKDLINRSH